MWFFPIGKNRFDILLKIVDIPDQEYQEHFIEMQAKNSRSGTQAAHPDLEAIAAEVRQARQRHGLTQAQLAGLAGTGIRFVGDLERAKPRLSLEKVLAVLAALGLRLQVAP